MSMVSFVSFDLESVLSLSLCFLTMTFLRRAGQLCCTEPPNLGLSTVSSGSGWCKCFCRKNTEAVSFSVHHSWSQVMSTEPITWLRECLLGSNHFPLEIKKGLGDQASVPLPLSLSPLVSGSVEAFLITPTPLGWHPVVGRAFSSLPFIYFLFIHLYW